MSRPNATRRYPIGWRDNPYWDKPLTRQPLRRQFSDFHIFLKTCPKAARKKRACKIVQIMAYLHGHVIVIFPAWCLDATFCIFNNKTADDANLNFFFKTRNLIRLHITGWPVSLLVKQIRFKVNQSHANEFDLNEKEANFTS